MTDINNGLYLLQMLMLADLVIFIWLVFYILKLREKTNNMHEVVRERNKVVQKVKALHEQVCYNQKRYLALQIMTNKKHNHKISKMIEWYSVNELKDHLNKIK
mgnify:FL=1